jgi:hypothetical protein
MRAREETGQALILALGGALALIAAALALVAIAGAVTGKGRAQRAADLVAISAVRSMRDDLPQLLSPPRLADGRPNPSHLEKAAYLARAKAAALAAARANGVDPERAQVRFPDAGSFAPVRAEATIVTGLRGGFWRGGRWRLGDGYRWRLWRPLDLPRRRGDEARRGRGL